MLSRIPQVAARVAQKSQKHAFLRSERVVSPALSATALSLHFCDLLRLLAAAELRHSRAGGNPEFRDNWFPACAGMTKNVALTAFGNLFQDYS
jgi:hypothetical protein